MNIVIQGSPFTPRDLAVIFPDEPVLVVPNTGIPNMLKALGVYKSSNQAIRAGRIGEIPTGYTEFKASKKVTLYIWNPTE